MTVDEIKKKIDKAKSILILTHKNPDGDAIGSSLAMYIILKSLKKNVDIVIPDVPLTYSFLPCCDEIKKESSRDNYDLIICLDCATLKLLDDRQEMFEKVDNSIEIDHHSTNSMYCDVNYVDPNSPAAAQVLISIFDHFKIEITRDIGTCLICGIITDTGGFQYQNTNVDTFVFAASLLKKGVNISDIYKKALNTKTRTAFELERRATERLEFFDDGKIAYTYITNKDIEEVGAITGDYEGIVDVGRTIEGVEVSIFLREQDDGFKGSLRSNYYVNVSDVCSIFGGGGHVHAAGCFLQMPLNKAKERIIRETEQYLK